MALRKDDIGQGILDAIERDDLTLLALLLGEAKKHGLQKVHAAKGLAYLKKRQHENKAEEEHEIGGKVLEAISHNDVEEVERLLAYAKQHGLKHVHGTKASAFLMYARVSHAVHDRVHAQKKSHNKVWFGTPTSAQPCGVDHGRNVPVLLGCLRTALGSCSALQREGIFRLEAAHAELAAARERLEANDEPPDAVCASCAPDVLAGLLKQYLRELPPTCELVPSHAMAELEAALRAVEARGAAPVVHLLADALPALQYDMLLWTLDLLSEAAALKEQSRMGAEALAVCFAPCLLPDHAGAGDLQAAMLAVKQAADVTKLLITHGRAICDADDARRVRTEGAWSAAAALADELNVAIAHDAAMRAMPRGRVVAHPPAAPRAPPAWASSESSSGRMGELAEGTAVRISVPGPPPRPRKPSAAPPPQVPPQLPPPVPPPVPLAGASGDVRRPSSVFGEWFGGLEAGPRQPPRSTTARHASQLEYAMGSTRAALMQLRQLSDELSARESARESPSVRRRSALGASRRVSATTTAARSSLEGVPELTRGRSSGTITTEIESVLAQLVAEKVRAGVEQLRQELPGHELQLTAIEERVLQAI